MNKLFICFVLISALFVSHLSFAQTHTDFSWKNFKDRTDRDTYKAAEDEFDIGNDLYEKHGNLRAALKHYLKAQEFNPNHALLNYRIGFCYINTINKTNAIEYFERAYELNPEMATEMPSPDFNVIYLIGMAHHLHEDWDEAIDWYNDYMVLVKSGDLKLNKDETNLLIKGTNKKIEECKTGKRLSKEPLRVFIDNIGEQINSPYPEYGAIISADESVLMFTSRRPGSTGMKEYEKESKQHTDFFEDIYVSYRNEDGSWSKAKNMGENINSDEHDATVALSPDGQTLLIYKGDDGGDIFECKLEGNTWSKPRRLHKNINTDFHESSASYSYDMKKIYFVSNKEEDSYGRHDIFMSEWDEKKERWGDPTNLGPVINTEYDEEAVLMHPDGKTLYFSSQGHNTMGGYDIFKSEFIDGSWTEPENIGYPVNGPDDDVFFVISANNRRGYYATYQWKSGLGEKDIYTITFLGPEKPLLLSSEDNLLASTEPLSEKVIEPEVEVSSSKTTILKGRTLDAITLEPVGASIELVDNTKNEVVATFKSNSETGKFLVSLPSGKNYGIAVKAEDYLFHSENFDIKAEADYTEVQKDIHLKKVSKGSIIVLRNVFFDFNKSTLRPESKPELDRLVSLMTDAPNIKVEIGGHTDSKGSDEYNQKLSLERAQSVVDYLTKQGISKSRLIAKGYGEEKPMATNETEAGRQLNRRTEFKILED